VPGQLLVLGFVVLGFLVLGFHAARAFLATGAHILWRASASFALKPVKVLADGTYLAELKPPRRSDGLTLATFLAKILLPGFFTRDRPDRASPRRTKKADDFPARKPGEPGVVCVTRRIEFRLLYPWQVT